MISALVLSLAAIAGTSAAKGTPTRSHHDVARQASSAFTPLASKHIPYNQIPYQVDPNPGDRGSQSGYNICNSTTQNQQSLCQTLIINSLEDFCLWGPPVPNSQVGDTEGQSIAWCTTNTHGTRVIPAGAITGAQFMRTPDYIQVTGLINQQLIDMAPDDGGGEMDPHGADLRGNPLGGLVYSNAYGTNGYTQIIEWHNFMGSNVFCLKACDPAGPNAANFCQHIYDRIGCQYNAPAAYVDGQFTSCLGDNQDFPGVYTGADGKVTTYQQPPESLGPISTMPYTARIPASSSCTTYQSTALYSNQPTPTVVASTSVASSVAVSSSGAASPAAAGTKAASSASKASASSTAAASGNAAGAPAKFGMGGVTGIAIGLIGAAIGAVVAL